MPPLCTARGVFCNRFGRVFCHDAHNRRYVNYGVSAEKTYQVRTFAPFIFSMIAYSRVSRTSALA